LPGRAKNTSPSQKVLTIINRISQKLIIISVINYPLPLRSDTRE
jgi:hypothetical protein